MVRSSDRGNVSYLEIFFPLSNLLIIYVFISSCIARLILERIHRTRNF